MKKLDIHKITQRIATYIFTWKHIMTSVIEKGRLQELCVMW